ncbi:DUF58 domain-containing protein [candidate division KSB3 bacterium]|uniref:DUF58 domain-containing protein n=1 Tax=candidate division KSB3 bacterium TaxID=2044937 RepID=A0A9D5JW42_9BACT|nr:DUF58 domain-containing protein [candidate division KSB3 bacterium]MBD3325367.1 DUF58 domain-containing protein [candidate division KSB3 bacterium]
MKRRHLSHLWRVLKTWLQPPRTLHITKAGWKFLGLTVIVGLAAINTGNNLLYLVFGLMLSFITVSGILSELMLRHVSLTRTFPQHIFARQRVPVQITLTNRKRRLSSFSLLVQDVSHHTEGEKRRYILKIAPQATVSLTYPLIFQRRGMHRPGKMRLSTRYPFGFFLKSATFTDTTEELLVYPEVTPLQPSAMPNMSASVGDSESSRQGHGTEIHSIREYVPGDGNTRIHWKSTAKHAKFMTKELTHDHQKKLSLVLDVSLPSSRIPPSFYPDVERAISLAASYLMDLSKQQFQLQLITPAQKSPYGHGQRHLFRLLRLLALLEPTNGQSRQSVLKSLQRLHQTHGMTLLISVNHLNPKNSGNFSNVVMVNSPGIEHS